jgi:hypothetical protein
MRLDLALTLGSARATVDVTAAAELLKTENTANGEVVEKASVEQLPLNRRMLLDLAPFQTFVSPLRRLDQLDPL